MSTWFRTYGFGEILPGLVIGALPRDGEDVAMLNWIGIRRVLNLVEDDEYEPGEREAVEAAYDADGIEEFRLAFVDFGNLAGDSLGAAVDTVVRWLGEDLTAYVHCRAGRQRSAIVAAGAIALTQGLDADEALAFVQARKPSADPLPHQRDDLRAWLALRAGGAQSSSA